MIYGVGKNPNPVLALTARNAASRFLSHRVIAGDRRYGWCPIVLRWQKRARRRENMAAGRATIKTRIQWFPQFHFHFATYPRDRDRRKPGPAVSRAAGIHETRVLLDHHRPNAATTKFPVQPQRRDRPVSRPLAGDSLRLKDHAGVTFAPRISWRSVAQPIVSPALRRARRPLFGEKRVRAGKQREEERPFQTQSRIWQHWLQVFSLRPYKPIANPSPRAPERQALKFQFERPEELVWRRMLRPAKTIDDLEQPPAVSGSYRTPVHSFSAQQAEPKVSSAIEKGTVLQVTKLDPGLLDRLTNDVIGRLEKRMRIERQRRGL